VTTNQSDESPEETPDAPADDAAEAPAEDAAPSAAAVVAERFAELVGAQSWSADHGMAKVKVSKDSWVESADKAHQNGMPFLSYLSAVDWAAEVAVGEALDEVEERYEVMLRLSSLSSADAVTLTTDLSKDDPTIDSLTSVLPGADWHEREAAEMFGIEFIGHPNPKKLYLPDAFEGFPLRKSYALLSREVKPWPGMVDVEAMPDSAKSDAAPSTENPEAPEAGE